MSCSTCPLRPLFENQIESRRLQRVTEAELLYETNEIIRGADADALMNKQAAPDEHMDTADRLVLKSLAQLLEDRASRDAIEYIQAKQVAQRLSQTGPEQRQLQWEDAACDGPKSIREFRWYGKKTIVCASYERTIRARALGWLENDD